MTARLVVLISGSGTNLQAIIDAIAARTLDAEIALVVSNRKSAYGLVRAEDAEIPTLYLPLKPYLDAGRPRADYDHDLADWIVPAAPDWIVLVGWMHILSAPFLDRFPRRVINLHPALPGQFPGSDAIQRAFEAYQRGAITESGCMIHEVIPAIDAGAVIAQTVVPFILDDTLESFAKRMHAAEHALTVEALRKVIPHEV
ncbi:MAG: phosphoribosylglycinamide formyltransferase [Chloroflexota bacterium]|nr:phosphoribosylglycinamide formyltransferase [Chloroflexota bacterium]